MELNRDLEFSGDINLFNLMTFVATAEGDAPDATVKNATYESGGSQRIQLFKSRRYVDNVLQNSTVKLEKSSSRYL